MADYFLSSAFCLFFTLTYSLDLLEFSVATKVALVSRVMTTNIIVVGVLLVGHLVKGDISLCFL